ncbi:MAG: hypothetical protein MUF34_33350 [Polyangiaceae bacterium]|jgi:hypothetical protein|nr:hypothetical protein [Polyangiaceae bacterium]
MCCFSPVLLPLTPLALPFWLLARLLPISPLRVSGTRIFARGLGAEQALVYSMTLSTRGEVAMILPVPVVPGLGEGALTFVDLEGYPSFFDDLGRAFPPPLAPLPRSKSMALSLPPLPRLRVHSVGAYEASFVPTIADFDRLDPRFRLPTEVWASLPLYADYGFAVFRLKKGARKRIHPMAFRFRTRAPGRLFFPTVHVHDGEVHPTADFDHELFCQPATSWVSSELSEFEPQTGPWSEESVELASGRWWKSSGGAGFYVDKEKAQGLVDLKTHLLRRFFRGKLANEDLWVDLAPPAPGSPGVAV